jgi:hypothetical protein
MGHIPGEPLTHYIHLPQCECGDYPCFNPVDGSAWTEWYDLVVVPTVCPRCGYIDMVHIQPYFVPDYSSLQVPEDLPDTEGPGMDDKPPF